MCKEGILHRDVNTGTIVITHEGRGRLIGLECAEKLNSTTEPAAVPVKDAAWYRRFEDWYKYYSGHPNYLENPHFTRDAAFRVYEAFDGKSGSAMTFLEEIISRNFGLLNLNRPESITFFHGESLTNVLRRSL